MSQKFTLKGCHMEIVKQEYDVSYSLSFGSVRSSASVNFQGNDYSPSVRITATNVYEVPNEKTGVIDDVEQKVIFKILCPDNNTAGLVAKAVKEKFRSKEVLNFHGGFPNDQRVINVTESYEFFLFDSKPVNKVVFKEDTKKSEK